MNSKRGKEGNWKIGEDTEWDTSKEIFSINSEVFEACGSYAFDVSHMVQFKNT